MRGKRTGGGASASLLSTAAAGFAAVVLISACGSGNGPGEARSAAVVSVAAAANLKFVMGELETAFREEQGDVELRVTYGASGTLFAQIRHGAPFDVLLSADREYPDQLVAEKMANAEDEFVYAIGRLVLWVPRSSAIDLEKRGMQAVGDPGVRKVSIANPRLAPYGRAAQSALGHYGLWESVENRLVLGQNMMQAVQFVESGAAEIGVVAMSLVAASEMRERGRFWEVPAEAYPPIEQAGVVLSRARNRPAAERFRAFLMGARCQAILERSGYARPGG